MDDLEVNPLYMALHGKFRREFEIACRMSYLIAIPLSDSLEELAIDQQLVNSHILVPSKLLKSHFHQLQAGDFEDIELDSKLLVCRPKRATGRAVDCSPIEVRILAEEIGYNVHSKEYRTLLIERPLVQRRASTSSPGNSIPPGFRAGNSAGPTSAGAELQSINGSIAVSLRTILAPLSPRTHLAPRQLAARRQRAQLVNSRALANHDECAKYLEYISPELTHQLELEAGRMQRTYMIMPTYLEDAAHRLRSMSEKYTSEFVRSLECSNPNLAWLSETIERSIRLSVENYSVYLLHGKLMVAIQRLFARQETQLVASCRRLANSSPNQLSMSELGANLAFVHFETTISIERALKRLPSLQSPIAMVSCLMQLMDLISERLDESASLKRLIGECSGDQRTPTPICSDDLIASLVHCVSHVKPTDLLSAIAYLQYFGWSSLEREQASYYLATLESAVAYILNSDTKGTQQDSLRDSDSMERSSKNGGIGERLKRSHESLAPKLDPIEEASVPTFTGGFTFDQRTSYKCYG